MRVLACVYNPIEYDGRVQRAATAMSQTSAVEVISPASGLTYTNGAFANARVTARAKGWLRHLVFWNAVIKRARQLRPDVVHAHDYYLAFPGLLAARISKARLVYDAHELIVPAENERPSVRNRIWVTLERMAAERADLVITANEYRAQRMQRYYGLKRTPLVIQNIPPAPVETLNGEQVVRLYPMLGKREANEILVVYEGDVNLERGLRLILEAMRVLPAEYRFVIIGSGPDAAPIERWVMENKLIDRIALAGKVPRAHLHDMLRMCDVGVVCYSSSGENNRYCAPNKVYEYAQACIAMVTTDNPPLKAMAEKYGIARTINATMQSADVAAAIVDVACNPRFRDGLKRFLEENRWEDEADRLRREIEMIGGRGAASCAGAA